MTNQQLFMFFRDATIIFATAMLIKYFVFLMAASVFPIRQEIRRWRLYHREIKRFGFVRPYTPLISVIIPAWNESVGILKTLESVVANPYPHMEIIVVNDGSTDDSRDLVDTYIRNYRKTHYVGTSNATLRQFYRPNGGKGKALNTGIRRSTGEIILTMDADSALAPDALGKLAEHFRDPKVAAVVGQVRVANSHGRVIGIMQRLEYLFGFYFKRAHCVLGGEYIYGGACAGFRKSKTFDYFGLFDEKNKTEDIEMSMRTKYHGLKSIYAEDVVCYTEGASSYLGLMNQRLRWKKGRFDTFLLYRRLFFSLDRRHNKALTWFILPYALFSELQLLLEPIGATLLITYSLISGEFVSLAMAMLFVGTSYLVVAVFSTRLTLRERLKLVLLWPVTWPLFYVLVWVEFHALLRSFHMLIRGDALEWQHWQREGLN